MIQIYHLPGGTKCWEIGTRFINDRLIKLVEDVMADYVQFNNEIYLRERFKDMSKEEVQKEWEKPIGEIIDMNRLREDDGFAEYLMDLLLPASHRRNKALYTFFGIYDLLKAEKAYEPELAMDYVLLMIINHELDWCEELPKYHKRIMRIPEPERTLMLAECEEEAAEMRRGSISLNNIDGEALMAEIEDLSEYTEICFEDHDCLMLDDVDEEALENDPIAQMMGVQTKGDGFRSEIETDNGKKVKIEFNIAPWQMENA